MSRSSLLITTHATLDHDPTPPPHGDDDATCSPASRPHSCCTMRARALRSVSHPVLAAHHGRRAACARQGSGALRRTSASRRTGMAAPGTGPGGPGAGQWRCGGGGRSRGRLRWRVAVASGLPPPSSSPDGVAAVAAGGPGAKG